MGVGDYNINPFTSPVGLDAAAFQTRGNDNILRDKFVDHQADVVAHPTSGTLANRPAGSGNGAIYYATDTGDTYVMVAGSWVLLAWAHWYGMAYNTTDQGVPAPNVGYAVTFNTSAVLRGVTLSNSSRLNVQYAGDYNVQFSVQLKNPDTAEAEVWLWYAKNGTNITDSAGRITVPKKHGGGDGHSLVSWNAYVTLAANDYIQLYWQTDNAMVTLETIPGTGSAPQSPSAILTINRI